MEGIIIAIVLVVLAFAYRILADKEKESRATQAPKRSQPSSYTRTQEYAEIDRIFKIEDEKRAASEFLLYKYKKVEDALFKRNYERTMALVSEMLSGTDPARDAIDRHYTLVKILEKLYSIREEDPIVYDLCLQICDFDFQNMNNFIFACNSDPYHPKEVSSERFSLSPVLVTPTKAAIILEKKGDLLSAIEICNMAIRWNACDFNGNTFDERKARLEKKLAKKMAVS